MATIDHRILIPVPQHVIWDYISKLANNPRWQVDCKAISILTSRAQGTGTRWRETSASGRDFVAEIRAWYDGLGYQYIYVERPPFRSAVGTLRLQEIAEGTIVQWTLEYETGGVLTGVRSALGAGRQLDTSIQGSLKKLYLQLKTDRARMLEPHIETKALMRDAPDAESRAQYKAKPHADAEPEPASAAPIHSGPMIREPLPHEEDTRPTRAIAAITDEQIAAAASAPPLREPDFMSQLPTAAEDTAPFQDPMGSAQPIDIDAVRRQLGDDQAQPTAADAPRLSEPATTVGQPAVSVPTDDALLAADEQPPLEITIPEPVPTDSQRLMDTSNMSIWEVFGVPRPSETTTVTVPPVNVPSPPIAEKPVPPTQKVKAPRTTPTRKVQLPAPQESPEHAALVSALVHEPHDRRGLRSRLRRRLVSLRRP